MDHRTPLIEAILTAIANYVGYIEHTKGGFVTIFEMSGALMHCNDALTEKFIEDYPELVPAFSELMRQYNKRQ